MRRALVLFPAWQCGCTACRRQWGVGEPHLCPQLCSHPTAWRGWGWAPTVTAVLGFGKALLRCPLDLLQVNSAAALSICPSGHLQVPISSAPSITISLAVPSLPGTGEHSTGPSAPVSLWSTLGQLLANQDTITLLGMRAHCWLMVSLWSASCPCSVSVPSLGFVLRFHFISRNSKQL